MIFESSNRFFDFRRLCFFFFFFSRRRRLWLDLLSLLLLGLEVGRLGVPCRATEAQTDRLRRHLLRPPLSAAIITLGILSMLLQGKLRGSKWILIEMGLLVLLKALQILFLPWKTLDFTLTLHRWFLLPYSLFCSIFRSIILKLCFISVCFQFGTEPPIYKPENCFNWGRQVKVENQQIHCRGGNFHHENERFLRPVDFPQSAWPSLQPHHRRYSSQPSTPTIPAAYHGVGSAPKRECAGTGVFLPRRCDNNPPQSRKRAGYFLYSFNKLEITDSQIRTWFLIFALFLQIVPQSLCFQGRTFRTWTDLFPKWRQIAAFCRATVSL